MVGNSSFSTESCFTKGVQDKNILEIYSAYSCAYNTILYHILRNSFRGQSGVIFLNTKTFCTVLLLNFVNLGSKTQNS